MERSVFDFKTKFNCGDPAYRKLLRPLPARVRRGSHSNCFIALGRKAEGQFPEELWVLELGHALAFQGTYR